MTGKRGGVSERKMVGIGNEMWEDVDLEDNNNSKHAAVRIYHDSIILMLIMEVRTRQYFEMVNLLVKEAAVQLSLFFSTI